MQLSDPRRPIFFTPTTAGTYVGGNYGFLNTYSDFSHPGTKIIDPTLEGLYMDYSEVEFDLAEAVERGFITGSCRRSLQQGNYSIYHLLGWNLRLMQQLTWLSQKLLMQLRVLLTKKKSVFRNGSLFITEDTKHGLNGEDWIIPKLSPPTGGNAPAGLAIPVRIIYPINEQTLNPASRSAAATAIGGDLATIKLWWDKF